MQDLFTQMLFCVAVGCALALVVGAALSQAPTPSMLGGLTRLAVAAGPLYLGANYVLYQGWGFAAGAAAGFAVGLWSLRGWWAPRRFSEEARRRAAAQASEAAPVGLEPAAPGIVYLAGLRRGASPAAAELRTRVFTVIGDDRRADRSMPSAA